MPLQRSPFTRSNLAPSRIIYSIYYRATLSGNGKPTGYDTVYFYGSDEATGEPLAVQRAAWKSVQEAGGKTFVACSAGTFEAMGGLLNCDVFAGKPDPEEAENGTASDPTPSVTPILKWVSSGWR